MKKLFLLMTVLLLSISLILSISLLGCKTTTTTTAAAETTTAETTKVAETTTTVAAVTTTEKVELTFYEGNAEEINKIFDQNFQKFMEANPNITIVRVHLNVEDMRNQFQTSAMAGSGPSMMLGGHDWVGPFAVANIVKKANEIMSDVSKFDPAPLTGVTYNKELWGIPFSMGSVLRIFYNTSMIQEPPQNTDEFFAKAKELTKNGITGFTYGIQDPYKFIPFLTGYGGWPLTEDNKANFDNEPTVKALKMLQDMIFKYKIVNPNLTEDEINSLFKDGKLAMVLNGDWMMASYKEALGDKLAMVKIPKLSDGGDPMSMSGVQVLFVNKRVEGAELEAVKKLVEFMTSKDFQMDVFSKIQMIPVTKEVLEDPSLKNDPLLFQNVEASKFSKPMPNVPEMRAAWDALFAGLQELISGKITPEAASKMIQQETEKKINEQSQ